MIDNKIIVYFVYDKVTKYTKIGKTNNINNRLKSLSVGNINLRLVYTTDKNNELFYHKKFKNKRIIREWFNLSVDDYKSVFDKKTKIPKSLFYNKKNKFKIIQEIDNNNMKIYTKWIAYYGLVGVTENYEYYDLTTCKKLIKEVHQGSIYYRENGSKKRYSFKKINKTKKLEKIEIINLPF
jgi:hypothetical protein